MKRFASVLSILFHPLIIPLYSAILLLWANPFAFQGARSPIAASFLYAIALCTFLMPMVGLLVLSRLEFGEGMNLTERQERIIPYFMVIGCFSIGLYIVNQLPIPSSIKAMMFGALASIILSFFWGNFMDVSAHGVGMGTLIGVLIGLYFISYRDVDGLFIIGLIMTGIVLSAQVFLDNNTVNETLIGFAIGFACQILTFILFLRLGL